MAQRLAILLPVVLLWSCAQRPLHPPEQYRFVSPSPIGSFVNTSYADVGNYIVRDVSLNADAGVWRWAGAHPQLRIYIETAKSLTFSIDYACADDLFPKTGPVTLTFSIDGKPFGRTTCTHAGRNEFSMKMPSGILTPNAINLLSIEPDKTTAGEHGARLGFILFSAGFLS